MPKVIEGRFEVQLISADALAQFMKFRGHTLRSLADKAGCSHGTIGNMRNGTRRTCNPDTARKIAKALDTPVEALFVAKVSHVSRYVDQSKPGRRAA